jgi:hypothetical protein
VTTTPLGAGGATSTVLGGATGAGVTTVVRAGAAGSCTLTHPPNASSANCATISVRILLSPLDHDLRTAQRWRSRDRTAAKSRPIRHERLQPPVDGSF